MVKECHYDHKFGAIQWHKRKGLPSEFFNRSPDIIDLRVAISYWKQLKTTQIDCLNVREKLAMDKHEIISSLKTWKL